MRAVIGPAGIRSWECTLATTTSSRPSRSSVWSRVPSSRMSTSIPVRMRNGASSLLSRPTSSSCSSRRSRGQAAGDRQPGRVVGQRDPLVPEVAGRLGHLPGRAAAIRPVRVGVAVTAQRRPQCRGLRGGRLGQQPGQVVGLLPGGCLGDDLGGGLADPGEGLQGAIADPLGQLARGQAIGHLGGPAERPHPVGRRGGPLKLERDLPQRLHWFHTPQIPGRSGRPGAGHARGFTARVYVKKCKGLRITGRASAGEPRRS